MIQSPGHVLCPGDPPKSIRGHEPCGYWMVLLAQTVACYEIDGRRPKKERVIMYVCSTSSIYASQQFVCRMLLLRTAQKAAPSQLKASAVLASRARLPPELVVYCFLLSGDKQTSISHASLHRCM